jgi:hypothetical protein
MHHRHWIGSREARMHIVAARTMAIDILEKSSLATSLHVLPQFSANVLRSLLTPSCHLKVNLLPIWHSTARLVALACVAGKSDRTFFVRSSNCDLVSFLYWTGIWTHASSTVDLWVANRRKFYLWWLPWQNGKWQPYRSNMRCLLFW